MYLHKFNSGLNVAANRLRLTRPFQDTLVPLARPLLVPPRGFVLSFQPFMPIILLQYFILCIFYQHHVVCQLAPLHAHASVAVISGFNHFCDMEPEKPG